MAGEKTEKATPKRKQDERKKGNIFQSREVVVVFSLVIMFFGLKMLAPIFLSAIQQSLERYILLSATQTELGAADVRVIFIDGCKVFLMTAMPLLLIGGAVSVVFTMAQTRMLVSFKAMEFKPSRLNPISGIKKMFSMRGLVELLKSLLKITILGVIIFNVLKDRILLLPRLMDMEILQAFATTGDIVLSIVQTTAVIFAFVALFDYLYQWYEYEKNLRMSKQEIKEEYKQTEGDPQIKGKIKERQQAQARRRMMQNVPNADVVIRNPTHLAIAIGYDPEKNNAPMVLAKGADRMALRIVEEAQKHNIVITENKPLARGLYEAVDLEREIPEEFYRPVAEVLAFVYSLKKKELK